MHTMDKPLIFESFLCQSFELYVPVDHQHKTRSNEIFDHKREFGVLLFPLKRHRKDDTVEAISKVRCFKEATHLRILGIVNNIAILKNCYPEPIFWWKKN